MQPTQYLNLTFTFFLVRSKVQPVAAYTEEVEDDFGFTAAVTRPSLLISASRQTLPEMRTEGQRESSVAQLC